MAEECGISQEKEAKVDKIQDTCYNSCNIYVTNITIIAINVTH